MSLDRVIKFVLKYKYTIACIIYFYIITLLFNLSVYKVSRLIAYPTTLTFLFILNILAKTKYSLVFTLLLSLLITFDAYFAYEYNIPAYLGLMASIFETNTYEALGMLKGRYMVIIILLSLTTFLIFTSRKELRTSSISLKKSIIILFLYLGVFIPSCCSVALIASKEFRGEFMQNPLLVVQQLSFFTMPFVYNTVLTMAAYKHEMHILNKYKDTDRKIPKDIHLVSKETPEKIFLIIGESSWREHYSLYGYKEPTTPFLDSLSQNKIEGFYYCKAFSPAAITREAVRLALSFSTPFSASPLFEQFNLIEMAKEAGYETVWISNQNKIGFSNSYIGFIASTADRSYFPESSTRDDLDLVDKVKKQSNPGKKQFIILHLVGSHLPYQRGYDEVDEKAINSKAAIEVVDYDRTIHHTDRFLRKIYKLAEQEQSSLMLYLSDHGETIGLGHGYLHHGANQFEIPFVIINKGKFPVDLVTSKYIDKESGLLNTTNTIYILSEILGYSIPEKMREQTLKDSKYIYHTDAKTYLFKDIQQKGAH